MMSSAVRERPILFSGADVIAILAGQKTQARRAMKLPSNWEPGWEPLLAADGSCDVKWMSSPVPGVIKMGRTEWLKCPFGVPGDRLWVRETFATHPAAKEQTSAKGDVHVWGSPVYQATFGGGLKPVCEGFTSWKSSRYMPRWASRLTLEIVSVRVERLNAISEEDARAEGLTPLDGGPEDEDDRDWKICPTCGGLRIHNALGANYGVMFDVDCTDCDTYRKRFRHLWDSINGKRDGCSWAANPWVWVIEFKPVQP